MCFTLRYKKLYDEHTTQGFGDHFSSHRILPALFFSTRVSDRFFYFAQRNTLLAAFINAELLTEQWTLFSSKAAEQDVVVTFSNSVVLPRIIWQLISEMTSTRKRISRDTVFQAVHCKPLFSPYSPVTSAVFENKRFKPQLAKAKLPKKALTSTLDLI